MMPSLRCGKYGAGGSLVSDVAICWEKELFTRAYGCREIHRKSGWFFR